MVWRETCGNGNAGLWRILYESSVVVVVANVFSFRAANIFSAGRTRCMLNQNADNIILHDPITHTIKRVKTAVRDSGKMMTDSNRSAVAALSGLVLLVCISGTLSLGCSDPSHLYHWLWLASGSREHAMPCTINRSPTATAAAAAPAPGPASIRASNCSTVVELLEAYNFTSLLAVLNETNLLKNFSTPNSFRGTLLAPTSALWVVV